MLRKCSQTDIADAIKNLRPDRANFNKIADYGHVKRFGLAALNLYRYFGADLAAQFIDRLREREANDRFIIHCDNKIFGLQPRLCGRRVINWRDHFDHALFHSDLNTQSTKAPFCLLLHIAEIFGIKKRGMWVQRGQHAIDGGLNQRFVIHLINIGFAHALKHVAKQAKLAVGFFMRVGLCGSQ